jgi:peptidoglycan-N-acetylglucosamine deacetylase
MKFSISIITLLFTCNINAKEVALSFDDAPRRITGHFSGLERAQALIKQLHDAEVKDAVFFCNSARINSETKKIIEYYNDSGFTIGNHTHSHVNFNTLSFTDYSEDFLKADHFLSKYSNFSHLFRFPYLKEGNDLTKRNQMREFLKSKNYQNAYITVDFNDWYLEDLFRKSIESHEKVNLEKLKALYISLAKESLDFYDALAVKHLGRSPKHVLLLHETDIAALFIKDLVIAMRSWGWKVISSQEAYTDNIAMYRISRTMNGNPGRIGEIALDKGHSVENIWPQSASTEYIKKRYQSEVLSK